MANENSVMALRAPIALTALNNFIWGPHHILSVQGPRSPV